MRKEESEFKTCFISEAGTMKTNKDYFAYTELDDYACWVIASGIDSEEEKESAKIVVESILGDFMDNPSISKSGIKKYLYNANRLLKSESLNISLNASVAVVVSDYSKIVWAVCGNTRLYHLRAGDLNFKSKDQSLSQVMADKGKIDTRELNSHEEANNLTCCLGMSGMFRPIISKKFELLEGDAILLCTGGFIRGIDDIEIPDALQETKEPSEFIDNLEEIFLSKQASVIDNYTLAAVFAVKLSKKDSKSKAGVVKKIAAIALPLLLILVMLLVGMAKMHSDKLKNVQELSGKIEKLQKSADDFVIQGNYKKALPCYESAAEYADKLDDENKSDIEKKQKITETIIEADTFFQKGDYDKAMTLYDNARKLSAQTSYEKKRLMDRIGKTRTILDAYALSDLGDIELNKDNFLGAKLKYQKAKVIADNMSLAEFSMALGKKINEMDSKKPQIDTNDSSLVAVTGVDGRLFRLLGSAAKALQLMQQSAMKDGIGPPLLLVESGYRSDEEQKVLYEDKVNELMTKSGYSREKAQEEADIWVAPPGCSAHRTGRAIDLNMSIESTSGNAEALKKTKEYEWLKNNAVKFGFYNYEVEPWHWEYNPIK